ncbi:MAG: hypothetical protein AB9897_05425 [Anaerolineaceae bacterium]
MTLIAIAAGLLLFFTRCLWNPGFCPTQITIKNSSPYAIKVTLQGEKNISIDIPKCSTCVTFENSILSECPKEGEIVTRNIEAGQYLINVSTSGDSTNPTPYNGVLLIEPQQEAFQCFFVTENGFLTIDNNGNLVQSTATPQIVTDVPDSQTIISPTQSTTKQFVGANYSLNYPMDWFVEQGPANAPDQNGIYHDLVLGAYTDISQGSETPVKQELGKVLINFVEKPEIGLNEWIVQNWSWLNSTLQPTTINNIPAFTGESSSADVIESTRFLWFEYDNKYYLIESQLQSNSPEFLAEYEKVISSIVFK